VDKFAETVLAAAFAGVEFPVERESTSLGHDIVEHTARGQDGADLEPTGWRARRGSIVVPLFIDLDPALFPDRHDELIEAIRRNPIGDFTHPFEGLMRATLKEIQRDGHPDERSGVRLTIQWIEHLASASSLTTFSGSPATDAPASAVANAATADTEMALADPAASYTPTSPVVVAQLAYLESDRRSYGEVAAALRAIQDVVDTDAALPAFAGVGGYAAVRALADLGASVAALRSRYLPETSRIRTIVTRAEMADYEVAQQEYGDARFAPLIRQANTFTDNLAIPPGTTVVLLPAESA
jgi:prophage DNA circulation protein